MAEVLVLYQISNDFPPAGGGFGSHPRRGPPVPSYNAFRMPRGSGVTLASVKRSCRALRMVHPGGSDGYHWRVRVDERPNTSHSAGGGGGGGGVAYSWWDVQDENARLPVKEATAKELKRMLHPPSRDEGDAVTQEVTKAAKGAMKYMGKAMNAVAGGDDRRDREADDDLTAVRTPVICFKLLDLAKARAARGGGGGTGTRRASAARRAPARRAPPGAGAAPPRPAPTPSRPRVPAPVSAGGPRVRPPQPRAPPAAAANRSAPPTADLMGFHSAPPAPAARNLHHAAASTPTGARPGETRAEKLKREYAKKQAASNRVWDDVDQRWVEGPVKNGETNAAAAPSPAGVDATGGVGAPAAPAKVKGIAISRDNAAGKSAAVQAAVHARVSDMESAQQKAIAELRAREEQKAKDEGEEDLVRQRLEPKLKAWGEEHGKKKQLRALLANLHTILWEGSGWKQVSLADVLDDSKVKRVYFKASRVVHPDKTGHLDVEKRFVAKRVFDALTQAKVEWDEGKR